MMGRTIRGIVLLAICSTARGSAAFASLPPPKAALGRRRLSAPADSWLERETERFDPALPLETAWTAPSSWYTSAAFSELERDTTFRNSWTHVGHVKDLQEAGEYITCLVGDEPVVVVRDGAGALQAYSNVCRHHAMPVAPDACGVLAGSGAAFSCPYHGWRYRTSDGGLLGKPDCPRPAGFDAALPSFGVGVAPGGLVMVAIDPRRAGPLEVAVGAPLAALAKTAGSLDNLRHVKRVAYELECDWKVFCDNYLDGGYHVPIAHKALAGGIDMASYVSTLYPNGGSVQTAGDDDGAVADERLGGKQAYAFVYPNLMLNRYGPWLDTNTAYPTGPGKCTIVFDYFVEEGVLDDGEIAAALASSAVVQEEDRGLCEGVYRGLKSRAYEAGPYDAAHEGPMHHFHAKLHSDFVGGP